MSAAPTTQHRDLRLWLGLSASLLLNVFTLLLVLSRDGTHHGGAPVDASAAWVGGHARTGRSLLANSPLDAILTLGDDGVLTITAPVMIGNAKIGVLTVLGTANLNLATMEAVTVSASATIGQAIITGSATVASVAVTGKTVLAGGADVTGALKAGSLTVLGKTTLGNSAAPVVVKSSVLTLQTARLEVTPKTKLGTALTAVLKAAVKK